ncbi:hypothetical protein AYI69_g4996, partial [Smittium culicis]
MHLQNYAGPLTLSRA